MYYMTMYIMLTISVVMTAIATNCDRQGRSDKQPMGQFQKVSYNGWLLCTSKRHPKRLRVNMLLHFLCTIVANFSTGFQISAGLNSGPEVRITLKQ